MSSTQSAHSKVTFATILVAMGIIYGDIGTSPLYVLKAVVSDQIISKELIFGGLSLVFWTLTVITTFKYVFLVIQADNKGEGGIFSLFALTRRQAKWLIFPAMIGGSALLAEGMITPAISVSSAIEGLRILSSEIPTVPIVIGIISALFIFQQFGTAVVGKAFGPVMFIWFSMLAILGILQIIHYPYIIQAINPIWGYNLLLNHNTGLIILGAVFLCTTGAEALYSDLGHCGIKNIRISWIFVKSSLLLTYFGQGAWLMSLEGGFLSGQNPFYSIMPSWFLIVGIVIATAATIIASQAMISGSFTLISEAIRLYFYPKCRIQYPSNIKGQIYVPSLNLILWIGCIAIVLYFEESSNMEAAYGLSISATFMMTTILYSFYMKLKGVSSFFIFLFLANYLIIDLTFFIANAGKFLHGGYVTFLMGSIFFIVMWCWFQATRLKRRYTEFVALEEHIEQIVALSSDQTIPKYSTNLVYLTSAPVVEMIESKIIYSIVRKQPKRADVYWFIHVDVVDEPFTTEFEVVQIVPGKIIRIDFALGFRLEPRINVLFRQVIEELSRNGEVDVTSRYESLRKNKTPGDFKFVVLEKTLLADNKLPPYERFIMAVYSFLKKYSLSEEKAYGLDTSSVVTEKVPLMISTPQIYKLTRVYSEED